MLLRGGMPGEELGRYEQVSFTPDGPAHSSSRMQRVRDGGRVIGTEKERMKAASSWLT
jgi:hypothetical protein